MSAPAPLVYPLASLLAEPPGSERRYDITGATLQLADDLRLTAPIEGSLRISRTNRGVLVTTELSTGIAGSCSRCLRDIEIPMRVQVREEVLPAVDIATGKPVHPEDGPEITRLTDHHELDFGALAAEAISLNEPIAPLCEAACPGLCIVCGERLGPDHPTHLEEDVDPRLEALRAFRVDGGGESE